MRDSREKLIENLSRVYALLMKILIIEEHEDEALKTEDYDNFYEYIQYEGSLMNEIKLIITDIMPELVYYKKDPEIKDILASIEDTNKKILKRNIEFQTDVKGRVENIRRKLTSLNNYMPSSLNVSTILNVRA